MQITRWEKSSRTIEYKSVDDYILQWTIKIDVRVSEDIDAGRARLVVSLYDDSGRYTTEQIDDLGPLSYGWGGTNDQHVGLGDDLCHRRADQLPGGRVDSLFPSLAIV